MTRMEISGKTREFISFAMVDIYVGRNSFVHTNMNQYHRRRDIFRPRLRVLGKMLNVFLVYLKKGGDVLITAFVSRA
jgi:hypothetical protein